MRTQERNMVDVASVKGGIRIGKSVFLGQSDITTATNKVNLKSKWCVTLPWWWLSNLQDRTEPWAPYSLKPFWRIGWSHTKAGFMRSSFTNRERDDGSTNGHHNLWVVHLCDLAFLFPFMCREDQEELAAKLNKNDQQKWQMDFIANDMMQTKMDRADADAVNAMQPTKWMGMPVCSRLGKDWRSMVTWHSYELQIPKMRKHPNPQTQEDTLSLKFQRRWHNDLQRWDDYQRGLGEYATREHSHGDTERDIGASPAVDTKPRTLAPMHKRNRQKQQGSKPEFL